MTDSGLIASSFRAAILWKLPGRCGMAVVLLALFLSVFGPRSPGAHETVDTERVNAILAAIDAAASRFKSAAGSGSEGEAMFALGMMQVEATDVLNRDLAAHSTIFSSAGCSALRLLPRMCCSCHKI